MTSYTTEKQDLDMTSITMVEAATFNGDLIVEIGDGQARMEVTCTGKATYQVESLGKLLYIHGKKKGMTYAGGGVHIHLWLPAGLAFKLANIGGAIRISGVARSLEASNVNSSIETRVVGQCDMRLNNVNGSINVRETNGHIKLATVNGSAQLQDVSGHIEIKGTNSDVVCKQSSGQIQINASNGSFRLKEVTFEPGSRNWVKIGAGTIALQQIQAPGGLELRASAYLLHADLSEYAVHMSHHHLTATLPGTHPAKVELATSGEVSITG
jgi:muramidase (phage lysozyme)